MEPEEILTKLRELARKREESMGSPASLEVAQLFLLLDQQLSDGAFPPSDWYHPNRWREQETEAEVMADGGRRT